MEFATKQNLIIVLVKSAVIVEPQSAENFGALFLRKSPVNGKDSQVLRDNISLKVIRRS